MLHYISFGSGSSGNSSFLFTETDGLLIDAGIGIRALKRQFKNFGLHMSSVKNILITHDHADQVKSLRSRSREYNMPGLETKTPFGVPHDSADNVGYCIQYKDVTFVLMTDIGHLTDEMKGFISKANYLVIEADYEKEMLISGPYPEHLKRRILSPYGHKSNEECAMALAENATSNLKHVWLCHLSDENNHPDLAEKSVKQILRSHGIVVGNEPGADFKLEVLKRKTPTGIFELK